MSLTDEEVHVDGSGNKGGAKNAKELKKSSVGRTLGVSVRYASNEALGSSRTYGVGLVTVLLVVAVVALLQNAVVRSSSVFVRLSETQVGETDILLVPDLLALQDNNSSSSFPPFWLNETHVRRQLLNVPGLQGTAPRWTLLAKAVNPSTLRNSSVIALVFDTQRETEIGMGRTWVRRPPRWDETYVSASLLNALNVTAGRGNKIRLQIDLLQLLPGFDVTDLTPALYEAFRSTLLTLATASNGTINVNQTLQALGIQVPPDFCLGGSNFSDVSLSILCPSNGTQPIEIVGFNNSVIVIPLDEACRLLPGNVTVRPSELNISGCIDINQVPAAELPAFLDSFSLPVFENLVGPQIPGLLSPRADLTVLEAVDNPDGKWPGALGNVMVLEMGQVPTLLKNMLPTNNLFLNVLLDAIQNSGTGGVVNVTTGNSTLVSSIQALNQVLAAVNSLTPENIAQYALLIVVMLRDRYSIYLQSPNAVAASFTGFNNAIFNSLGYRYAAIPQNSVQQALDGVVFVKLFLDQIFGSVMAVLIVLGAMLIYSLLLGNVNDKTYEYGMLRALGLERNSLIGLLLVTALFFTIPGIGFGLLAAWVIWVPLSLVFQLLTNAPSDFSLDWSSVVLGIVVGLVMPIVSNIGPISRALNSTLRDSLDVYHNVQNETSVKMIRLKDMGFRPLSFVLSIVVIVIGFLVYYLIPYAFTFEDFPLFLGILQVMLLSMVVALCLLATTLQPLLEQGVLWLLVWGKDAKMFPLMLKNLSAHRPRNQKTALMFTLSLGFIIFAGASFSLQAATVGDTISSFVGADGVVSASSWNNPLPENDLRNVLEQERVRPGSLLENYAFATFQLRDNSRVTDTRLSNLAAEPNRQINIYGVEWNHLDVTYERFFVPTEWTTDSITYNTSVGRFPNVIESLYSASGKQRLSFEQEANWEIPAEFLTYAKSAEEQRYDSRNNTDVYVNYLDIIMSEALRTASSVNTGTPLRFYFSMRDSDNSNRAYFFYGKARALVSKIPGFFYSSYSLTANRSPVLISMDSFRNLTNMIDHVMEVSRDENSLPYSNISGVLPKETMWFRLKAGASAKDVDNVIDKLRNFISDDSVVVFNVLSLVAATSTASNAMLVFFNVVAVINSLLSFFLLWISFDANVRFNGWEVGVLRSIGVSASQTTRLYIYEAVAVVLTAVCLGTVVGVVVSVVLTLQFDLFLELPFVLYFPVTLFLIVLFLSLALAVVGAFIPANQFSRQSIANVIRGI